MNFVVLNDIENYYRGIISEIGRDIDVTLGVSDLNSDIGMILGEGVPVLIGWEGDFDQVVHDAGSTWHLIEFIDCAVIQLRSTLPLPWLEYLFTIILDYID